jgi:hypothetical protein
MALARTAAAALLLAATATPALADIVHWINPAGGAFETNANWDRGSPPAVGDTAFFDLAGTYTVTVGADHTVTFLNFSRGDVTVNLGTHALVVGSPQSFGSFTMAPAESGGSCTARLVGGTVALWGGPSLAPGATVSVNGTNVSDTAAGGNSNAQAFYSLGSSVILSNGGTINTQHGTLTGANVQITSGGFFTAQILECTQPSNITVTGANSRLRAEDFMTLRGSLRVDNGGHVFLFSNDRVTMLNCQAVVDGSGSAIAANPQADAASSILVQNGGSLGSGASNVTCNAAVTIDPGCTLGAGGHFTGLLSLDFDSTINATFLAVDQGLTITLDGLTSRTTPLIFCGAQGTVGLAGPLTIVPRNANALRSPRTFTIIQHSVHDVGTFASLSAPALGGNRTLTMSQTGATGVVTVNVVPGGDPCWSADFDSDGDTGTDADIEAFFACIANNCCPACGSTDFNSDGDASTDIDIEAFFRVLAGGAC